MKSSILKSIIEKYDITFGELKRVYKKRNKVMGSSLETNSVKPGVVVYEGGSSTTKYKIMNMFECSDETLETEKELDLVISNILMDFLRNSKVCSDIDLKSLIIRFKDSKIHNKPIDVSDYFNTINSS